MRKGAELKDLAFFYMADRDWIVINKEHRLYEYYSQIVSVYLDLSKENRKKARGKAPSDTVKDALDILEYVLKRRELIHRGMVV